MIKINCDLCGKVDEKLFKAIIESVELNVCGNCGKFGKVIGQVRIPLRQETPKKTKIMEETEEKIELMIENYFELIRKKRESMNLSQKDFASKLNEKESTIHKIETGTFEPSLALAKKLEKFLGIKLVEEHQEKHEKFKRGGEQGFTLGDFIKLKK